MQTAFVRALFSLSRLLFKGRGSALGAYQGTNKS